MERLVDSFAEPEFIELNLPFFERFVELRAHGYSSRIAFIRAFGADNYGQSPQEGYRRTQDIESSDWYGAAFELKLKELKANDLWNEKESIHQLLSIVRSEMAKDSVRLNAVKELNVLCGITIVDENGKTKAGRSLDDFYRQQAKPADGPKTDGSPAPASEPQDPVSDAAENG